jgi:hypothetical protein
VVFNCEGSRLPLPNGHGSETFLNSARQQAEPNF